MRAWRAPILLVLIGACSSDGAGPSNPNPPDVPVDLVSTSLDGAVALTWEDNAFNADPSRFQDYRVFSTSRTPQWERMGATPPGGWREPPCHPSSWSARCSMESRGAFR
jgi:hypothetical protein